MSTDIKNRPPETIDCACVIHGKGYDWIYVERLYSMLQRNLSGKVQLHVYTEHKRKVPAPFIKHDLIEWPTIIGPRKSWWYKMQMFDAKHFSGRLLYFDLDVVLTGNIDWIWQKTAKYFWAIKDFKYLWRPSWTGINSSVMYWETPSYHWVWEKFQENHIDVTSKRYHGDQDFLSAVLPTKHLRYLDQDKVRSYRWQVLDGGMDMRSKIYRTPNSGSHLTPETSVVIFHGKPKPHEANDDVINSYWQ